jgi:hypothetical protein
MAGRANIPTSNSALIAIIADEVIHPDARLNPPCSGIRIGGGGDPIGIL